MAKETYSRWTQLRKLPKAEAFRASERKRKRANECKRDLLKWQKRPICMTSADAAKGRHLGRLGSQQIIKSYQCAINSPRTDLHEFLPVFRLNSSASVLEGGSTCMPVCVCMSACTHTRNADMHTHTYTYTFAYTHTRTHAPSRTRANTHLYLCSG